MRWRLSGTVPCTGAKQALVRCMGTHSYAQAHAMHVLRTTYTTHCMHRAHLQGEALGVKP